ncbi:unnamed protein product [Prorocentrum cordatum]|uniref:Uncharacterized protein n=1 Tax=Prorocentrum cordatum TaxID=2364126 RepID=A0ABN9WI69_9DINO|nr:unnamed protein product [Polarella glacialis]
MASRFDHFRHLLTPSRSVKERYGACPTGIRSLAVERYGQAEHEDLQQASSSLPELLWGSCQSFHISAPRGSVDGLLSSLECAVCYATLYQPVTVACGHTFCKRCLARQLDFERGCPLCRGPLAGFIDQYAETAGLGQALQAVCPESVQLGLQALDQEIQDMKEWSPIFVCTLAFPHQECPLHIFEPRYRLMMRRAITSGTRRFGMCAPVRGPPEISQNGYSRIGTMLFIREIKMLPDGRSLVDCIGEYRFAVKDCGERDGYNVARVDKVVETSSAPDELVSRCRSATSRVQTLMQRVRLPLDLLGEHADSDDPDKFYWGTISKLPVSDGMKFKALTTEDQLDRFMHLASLLDRVSEVLLSKHLEDTGSAGDDDEVEDVDVDAEVREEGDDTEAEGPTDEEPATSPEDRVDSQPAQGQ